jgi:hypothetical protein
MAKSIDWSAPTVHHLRRFDAELSKAGLHPEMTSPMLFPDYVRKAETTTS